MSTLPTPIDPDAIVAPSTDPTNVDDLDLHVLSGGQVFDADAVAMEIAHYGRIAMQAVFEIGKRLLWAKRELGHGQFEVWCGDSLPFTQRTARNYMRASRVLLNHPRLLESAERAGLKKTLALVTHINQVADEHGRDMVDAALAEGHIPESPLVVDELEHLPYLELKKRLARRDSELGEAKDTLTKREQELERARTALADAAIDERSLEDQTAEELLKELTLAHYAHWKGQHAKLGRLARGFDNLGPATRAKICAFVEATRTHATHEAVSFEVRAGLDEHGVEHLVREVVNKAVALGLPVPEAHILPFIGLDDPATLTGGRARVELVEPVQSGADT